MLHYILLQATTGETSTWSQYSGILMFALIFVVFYLFMIRPQQRRQKEIAQARENIKVGEVVITSGGIHGRVKEIKSDSFILDIDQSGRGTLIQVSKDAVFAQPANSESK